MARKIDHIVYAVSDLEKAIASFEQQTGVPPFFGGYHLAQGTKNALVNLGDRCYLEFLAVDRENAKVPTPHWMGVDFIDTPQITRWALKSADLAKDSKIVTAYQTEMGVIQPGSRKMTNGDLLTWSMVMPLATPKVELIPFMTDWSKSASHPTDVLPAQCQMKAVKLVHPNPESIQQVLDALGAEVEVEIGVEPKIVLQLMCPNGMVEMQ